MSDLPGFLDFTRPGRDNVDDSVYPPFIRFWKRYARNFIKLIQVNFAFALLSLPVYVWLTSQINVITTQGSGEVTSLLGTILLYYAVQLPVPLVIALLVLSVLILGPSTAALTYSAVDAAWDRPGLLWGGFWSAWKKNFMQGLPVGILDFAAIFATLYYLVDGKAVFGSFGIVFQLLWIAMGFLYCLIRVYIYPMMVTVQLPFTALFKNCLILVLLKPWRPLVVVTIAAVLGFLCSAADIILIPGFLYSFVAFTAAFLTYPVIDEYLLNPKTQD